MAGDYWSRTRNQWGGALGGAGAGALSGAAIGSFIPGIGTVIGAGAGALIGGLSGWGQGYGADEAGWKADSAAEQAAEQRAAIDQGWSDLIARNQGRIDKSQIYDAQGNKLESNPFWTNLRSQQSDIRSTFDAQQHDLSGVIASRGMMGGGQEAASRAALAGGQARGLADFETGRVGQQEAILRSLEGEQESLQAGKLAASQGLYGMDVAQQNAALQRSQDASAAMWQGIGDMATAGGKVAGMAYGQNPAAFVAGGAPANPGLQVSMDGGIAQPPLDSMGLRSMSAGLPDFSANPFGSPARAAPGPPLPPAGLPSLSPALSPWYEGQGREVYRPNPLPAPAWGFGR